MHERARTHIHTGINTYTHTHEHSQSHTKLTPDQLAVHALELRLLPLLRVRRVGVTFQTREGGGQGEQQDGDQDSCGAIFDSEIKCFQVF